MYLLARKMPGFDRVEQTMPDTMHTVAVQMKHLHRCLAGKAPEDSLAVRKEEMSLNRFPECWPTSKETAESTSKFSDPHCLGKKKLKSKQQLEEADRRTKQITVPAGDPYSPKPIFSRMSRMNSHEWKEVSFVFCP